MIKISNGLIESSYSSYTFNHIHPFFMSGLIDSNVIGPAQPFHCTDKCTEMIGPKKINIKRKVYKRHQSKIYNAALWRCKDQLLSLLIFKT